MRRLYLSVIYALLYLPIIVLILLSFNSAKYSLQWQGFSFKWYQVLVHDHGLWQAFFHSIFLGSMTAIVSTVFALLCAIHCFIHYHKQPRLLAALMVLMVIIPDIVLGISLLIFFQFLHLSLGFISLLIAHITFCLPFAMITINTRLKTLDKNIYDSALDLGASRFHAIAKIMVPLLAPAIISALLLCFTLSFDDVIISYFVAGPDFSILPLFIFSLVRSGVTPELNALCAITLAFSIFMVLLSQYINQREL